jgi:hypothetical protein
MNSTPKKSGIWFSLFKVSRLIVSLGSLLGFIAYAWKGREFTNDELGPFLWPLVIAFTSAALYLFAYVVQTSTSKGLRYYFIYPVMSFIIILVTLALLLEPK